MQLTQGQTVSETISMLKFVILQRDDLPVKASAVRYLTVL